MLSRQHEHKGQMRAPEEEDVFVVFPFEVLPPPAAAAAAATAAA